MKEVGSGDKVTDIDDGVLISNTGKESEQESEDPSSNNSMWASDSKGT